MGPMQSRRVGWSMLHQTPARAMAARPSSQSQDEWRTSMTQDSVKRRAGSELSVGMSRDELERPASWWSFGWCVFARSWSGLGW